MKAMEPRLVEKHACRVVLHGCHQQSPPRWFQEKENQSYIWKRNRGMISTLKIIWENNNQNIYREY